MSIPLRKSTRTDQLTKTRTQGLTKARYENQPGAQRRAKSSSAWPISSKRATACRNRTISPNLPRIVFLPRRSRFSRENFNPEMEQWKVNFEFAIQYAICPQMYKGVTGRDMPIHANIISLLWIIDNKYIIQFMPDTYVITYIICIKNSQHKSVMYLLNTISI